MGTNDSPSIVWTRPLRPIGPEYDPKMRLMGTVEILGVPHHVNAEEVVERDSEQVSHDDDQDTYVNEIQLIVGGRGHTVRIDGRDYLIAITPYAG